MSVQFDRVKVNLAKAISEALDAALPEADIYSHLAPPPQANMGDYAFACFPLAKSLKQAPQQIAAQLAGKIKSTDKSLFLDAKAQGPYLNFVLDHTKVAAMLLPQILKGEFFAQRLTQNTPKSMIEYFQPNTHKELHVGHMRNLCLGNALIRLHRYAGYEILSATFPGDVGTHVAKCLWYLKYHNQKPLPQENRGEWLGQLYSAAHIKLEDELGSDKESQNRAELTTILKQLEQAEGEYYELWKETREWSITQMQEVCDWANVKFDHWYWESEVDSSSVQYAQQLYQQGLLVEDQGAIGMDLSADKLGFCLLIKSDGNGLYATKDVELARRKFDQEIERNIYIVDNRQSYHFKQVFKVLERIGFEQAKNCHHLAYEFVELPDGPMSSRKGNIIPLMRLIEQMQTTVIQQYLEKYRGDWSEEQIQATAKMVAEGAIKYGMVRMDNNKKIVFNMQEWLKLDGESGPYIQYAHARIATLCQKYQLDSTDDFKSELLTHSSEHRLISKLSQFNQVCLMAAEQYKTSALCGYLFELAKLFNSFYAECPIGKAQDKELQKARLTLSQAVAQTLAKGLDLLGIPAPSKM